MAIKIVWVEQINLDIVYHHYALLYVCSATIVKCNSLNRFQMRKYPPGSEHPFNGARLRRFINLEHYNLLQSVQN